GPHKRRHRNGQPRRVCVFTGSFRKDMSQITKIHNAVANLQSQPGWPLKTDKSNSQMLYGEPFEIFERKDGWLRGRSILDGYAGWINAAHDGVGDELPTHVVHTKMTDVYRLSDFKSSPGQPLSFMSRVTLDPEQPPENGFVKLKGRHEWVTQSHLMDIT